MWRSIDAYHTSLKQSEGKPDYTFYDGPPFATGLPHYGHILAGTIKDVVTRYAHQTGHHVIRKFGWDCHGLPVEYEIDKQHNISGKKDVLAMGIDTYNDKCRSIVSRYVNEWEFTVERFGRWIDFKGGYKTMDRNYMESVWWVFKQLYEKGLVYRSFRVMPYSTACQTPLSNFEKSQAYKTVIDPSIIVNFALVGTDSAKLLAWTTTPWTLPSNLALAVNPALTYVRFVHGTDEYICGKDRLAWVLKSLKWESKVTVESEFLGSELVGKEYVPLFDYFVSCAKSGKAFTVLPGSYVTADAGTCIVHQAPAFGEEDFALCVAQGVVEKDGTGMPCPVDDAGCFTGEVPDFVGQYFKTADAGIKQKLKGNGNLMFAGTESHEYPHCWRSDTPLMLKAVSSWFVKVADFRDKLVRLNEESNWVPKHVQEKRFKNWLSDARDWSVSRNRYWGTPLPLWVSENYDEIVCVGSVAELEEYTGEPLEDIHRQFVDQILIPSKKTPGTFLRRVEEVFDCWFESGSMPYAQMHYPFENKEFFEKNFPAKFIAEGLDQTRGWFYTLHVLAAHLFDKPAFENLIVNGLVLAGDGKKMSKRLRNYPDPLEVAGKYGADAVRMYMCNSPVVRAEALRFKEEGVNDVVKDIFLPLFNAYRFLVQEVTRFEASSGSKFAHTTSVLQQTDSSLNFTDRWIHAAAQVMVAEVREAFAKYELFAVAPKLIAFLENLTNWYIRMNRDRMRGTMGPESAKTSLTVLYSVVLDLVTLMAPLTPFITEHIYQNLKQVLPEGDARKQQSVHFVMIPEPQQVEGAEEIIRAVSHMQQVVLLGRKIRESRGVNLKTPILSITVISSDPILLSDIAGMDQYVCEELNALEVRGSSDVTGIETTVKPNFAALKARFANDPDMGKLIKTISDACKSVSDQAITKLGTPGGAVTFDSVLEGAVEFTVSDLIVSRSVTQMPGSNEWLEYGSNAGSAVVLMDFTPREDLTNIASAREAANKVQKLRKTLGLNLADDIVIQLSSEGRTADDREEADRMFGVLKEQQTYIESICKKPVEVCTESGITAADIVGESSEDLTDQVSLKITIRKRE